VILVEPAMVRVYALIERLAKSDLPVLVQGETGTGKEHAAGALHAWSQRAKGPFVTVNCAALPENLVESELFGHERGAFSSAAAAKAGLLETAHGGTLFLDEIGELPIGVQAKLLRALETKKVTRLGDTRERAVEVRFVAATNRDLAAEVEAGRFRRDLLFRVGAANVVLPPLRDRRREIPVLARTFLLDAAARLARPAMQVGPQAMQRLLTHAWPGNVRELRNVIEYVAATAQGPVVEPWELPPLGRPASVQPPPVPDAAAAGTGVGRAGSSPPAPAAGKFRPLADEIRELERTRITEALAASAGVQTKAAELLAVPVRTLFAKLRLYGIDPKEVARASKGSGRPPA
jgi:DNA-binding NtrC family response regulator